MYRLKADLTFEELDTLLACVRNERQKMVELKLEFIGEDSYLNIIDRYIQLLDTLKSKLMYVKL